jgi:hypothetical protein
MEGCCLLKKTCVVFWAAKIAERATPTVAGDGRSYRTAKAAFLKI